MSGNRGPNQHDVPGREGGVHRAGSVGDYQRFRPQQPQHPDRIADILKGPALIGVEAALHHRHVLTRQAAEHEPARVVRGGGSLHVGHILIGDGNGGLHFVAQRAQAGAQDQQHPGAEPVQPLPQRLRAFPILFHGIVHLLISFFQFSAAFPAERISRLGPGAAGGTPVLRLFSPEPPDLRLDGRCRLVKPVDLLELFQQHI